jgi:hypothetical protein
MFDALNRHVRPPGAPENWGVYELSGLPQDAPEGFTRWKGGLYRIGKDGHPSWKGCDKQWNVVGLISKETFKRLAAEDKANRPAKQTGLFEAIP